MASQTFSKFIRPEEIVKGQISDRDLDILEAVLRYRFSPTSELVRLVGGNEDVTQRRLRRLWEQQLINRWAFPGIRTHSEFYYYLDSREPLNLLAERRRLNIHPQMLEEVRNNREKDYATAATRGQHMKLGFLNHSLMISRMHFMLELAARKSGGNLGLEAWSQGGQLAGHKVVVPRVKATRQSDPVDSVLESVTWTTEAFEQLDKVPGRSRRWQWWLIVCLVIVAGAVCSRYFVRPVQEGIRGLGILESFPHW